MTDACPRSSPPWIAKLHRAKRPTRRQWSDRFAHPRADGALFRSSRLRHFQAAFNGIP